MLSLQVGNFMGYLQDTRQVCGKGSRGTFWSREQQQLLPALVVFKWHFGHCREKVYLSLVMTCEGVNVLWCQRCSPKGRAGQLEGTSPVWLQFLGFKCGCAALEVPNLSGNHKGLDSCPALCCWPVSSAMGLSERVCSDVVEIPSALSALGTSQFHRFLMSADSKSQKIPSHFTQALMGPGYSQQPCSHGY